MIIRGVLYIVSGPDQILRECAHSARTLKRHEPNLPIQVITSRRSSILSKSLFDYIDVMDEGLHPLKAKVRYLSATRFKTTLFLDADTEVRAKLDKVFALAETSDFAAAFDNLCDWSQNPPRLLRQESTDINTGMLLFNSTAEVMSYLQEWYRVIHDQDESTLRPGLNCDQVYFNLHLRDSIVSDPILRFTSLPNHLYNVRPWCWKQLKQAGLFSQIVIAHAHHLHHKFHHKLIRKISNLGARLKSFAPGVGSHSRDGCAM